MKNTYFTVYIEQDEDGIFIGSIPSVPSCHAQGKTQAKMLKNLQEVLKLCLMNVKSKNFQKTRFVGIQSLEATYA
ncbi:type II toxin-antitoxin system HicB family antitoxin [bacterium]|nr:type II toxin-antitoxin system HicB family antitoxin [bacterium]